MAFLALSGPIEASQAKPVEPRLAFPEAEGAGRFSAGGRGGKVFTVTTLDDAGPGSLRAAVETKGPRIIRFGIAGTIRLKSELVIREPRITIDGSGAPAGGIAIADHGLVVKADDVVIRHLRSRLGNRAGGEGDAISISSGRRIILDHVSASWSIDETLSASANYEKEPGIFDLTVQWSIISESLRSAGHAKGNHGYGSLIRGGKGSRFSFHHNLWAHHVQRMPRPGNYTPASRDPQGPMIEFRSNVFYNWGAGASGYNADKDSAATYAFIDNCYVSGPDSKGRLAFREENPLARSWFAGNSMDGVIPAEQKSLVGGLWNPLPAAPEIAPVRADPAPGGCEAVLARAGAGPRDAVDQRVVSSVRNRSGRIIDSQDDVGGWPDLGARP
ncbi:polysaccharide lyase family 1 protein [Novosphingobium sp. TH158]|uniref:pectate lyase family protein n=1 Tax=Novosphingobium sp. TH158 TaxID=2067455 RepID=UPI000C7D181B|nr:pectate lyase [Novosphingobium sp. TH158]PLK25729.1 pectate lyase [Novosphingobium sp. TH158]